MVILDLWGMVFHAMVVIAPIYILLLESIWACCVERNLKTVETISCPIARAYFTRCGVFNIFIIRKLNKC